MTAQELLAAAQAYQAEGLDRQIESDFGIENLAGIKLCFDQIRTALKDAETQLTDVMADAVPPNGELIEGIGLVSVSNRPSSPKWDSERLLSVMVARAMDERTVDEETGEYEHPAYAFLRVLKEVSPVNTASHGWRRKALKDRGIDPDEYCEVSGWSKSIRIAPEGKKARAA